ncbi:MAG: hypothetical protein ACREOO_10230 [bacterium]
MDPSVLLQKIWTENELPVLARSREAHVGIAAAVNNLDGKGAFAKLRQSYRLPETDLQEVIGHIWEGLQKYFASDYPELEKLRAGDGLHKLDEIRLWLWRRVVRSGNPALISSRFFADEFLFYRSLQEDRLLSWYGERTTEWSLQLLLSLFLDSQDETKRLRQQLYWPTAKLPADFQASRTENRALRRLWEARILVRFGNWVHLHPLVMLQLPEISSFASPVFKWREHQLVAHMPDGRIWPLAPFNLAALIFDETLALFGRDRRGWWRSFSAFATAFTRRPEDVASHFVTQCFDELGLPLRAAPRQFWKMFCDDIKFLDDLRAAHGV